MLLQLIDQCHFKQFCGVNFMVTWSLSVSIFTMRPSYSAQIKGLHASLTNDAGLVAGVGGAALYISPVMD